MGKDQEEDIGSGTVVKMGRVAESYERQDWDCSFENGEEFRCTAVLTETRKQDAK